MIFGRRLGALEIRVTDVAPPVPPHSAGGDVQLFVRISCADFAGGMSGRIECEAWLDFVRQLEQLNRRAPGRGRRREHESGRARDATPSWDTHDHLLLRAVRPRRAGVSGRSEKGRSVGPWPSRDEDVSQGISSVTAFASRLGRSSGPIRSTAPRCEFSSKGDWVFRLHAGRQNAPSPAGREPDAATFEPWPLIHATMADVEDDK